MEGLPRERFSNLPIGIVTENPRSRSFYSREKQIYKLRETQKIVPEKRVDENEEVYSFERTSKLI